jgi:lipopolysaccharide/colanic/teichoic acid biosynthesis glycosyltransferase
MSLVGPRPERPEIAEHVEQQLPAFHLRLYVKPGLTGLAQTKGTYATRFEDKLKLDILYTRSRSVLATDLSILLNTLRTVITPRKAR